MFNKLFLFPTTAWALASLLTIPLLYLLLRKQKQSWQLQLPSLFLLGFIPFFLVSFYFRQQPYGYAELVAFTVGPCLYLLARKLELQQLLEKYAHKLSLTVSTVAAGLSLHAIIKFLPEQLPRLSGLFQGVEAYTTYPNTFAFLLIGIIPLNLYPLFTKDSRWQWLGRLTLLLNLTALILTFSRGAYLGLISGIFLLGVALLLLTYRRLGYLRDLIRKSFPIIYILVAAIILSMGLNQYHAQLQPADLASQVPLTEDISQRLTDQSIDADQSTDERIQFWQGSLELIKKYPLFGVGSDGFRAQYPSVQQELLATSTHPHNLFLKLAVENGIPAALSFFFLLTLLFIGSLRQLFRLKFNSNHFWWQALTLTGSASMAAHLLVDYNLNAMLLWLCFWLLLVMQKPAGQQYLRGTSYQRLLNILIGLLLVVVLAVSSFHLYEYQDIKKAQALMSTNPEKAATEIIYTAESPFMPLRYQLLGELALLQAIPVNEQPLFEEQIGLLISRYPKWQTGNLTAGRYLASRNDPEAALQAYYNAILIDPNNDLQIYDEYLQLFEAVDQNEYYQERSANYLQLINQYTAKLKVNAHNTVATDNPQAASKIIALFLKHTQGEELEKWQQTEKEFSAVLQDEQAKFQQLFN